MPAESENRLGAFLRDRRTRCDPAAFGYGGQRRRTPGLRREEVAQRAQISVTWYTWLEQGRGGAPSADVLDRVAGALMLTEPEREHLYLLALGRPPEVRYTPVDGVSPRLQRVLDAFEVSPAMVKTATWDIVAWNRAAAHLLIDYATLPRDERNVLRLMFARAENRDYQLDWEQLARFVVGGFRADVARAAVATSEEVTRLVDELSRVSPEFRRLWAENDVSGRHEGVKRIRHPAAGLLELEFSSFAVDGRPELTMIVHQPTTPQTAERIRAFLRTRSA